MEKYAAVNSKMVRNNNKSIILWKLFNKGAMSRIALAKECNLTGGAVTIIVKTMLDKGYLIENGTRLQRNIQGRKEVMLDINYNKFLACNVNIESDKIHISLCTLKDIVKEEILFSDDVFSENNPVDLIKEKIKDIICGEEKNRVIGIGIGCIGAVDEEKGILNNTYGFFPKNYDIKTVFEKEFCLPVFVCNNCRAHAKAIINEKNTNFLYIKHGPKLGCAITINGKVINGFNNFAGEIGHCLSDSEGENNLEYYITENNLLQSYKLNNKDFNGSVKDLYDLYGKDSFVTKILNNCIKRLVFAVINSITLIDPEKVIVSGGIFDRKKTFNAIKDRIEKIKPSLSEKIELLPKEIRIKGMASVRLVYDELFFNMN